MRSEIRPHRGTARVLFARGSLGCWLGLGFASFEQFAALNGADPSLEAPSGLLPRAIALLGTIATFGLLHSLASVLWQVRQKHLHWRGMLRLLALLLVASLAMAHAVSIAVFELSGQFLNVGSVEFFAGSAGHVTRLMVKEYAVELALVVLVGVAAALAAGWRLQCVQPAERRWFGSTEWTVGVWALVAAVSYLGLGAVGDAGEFSPELALLGSAEQETLQDLDAQSRLASVDGSPAPLDLHAESSGPLLAEAVVWRAELQDRVGRRPNVLLVMLESVGIDHLGYEGYSRKTTQNLDRIASRGVVAVRSWTTATHSNYAQMAVLSSLFPRRTSGLDVYERLDYPRVLFHDVFHELGYRTATISSQDETWQGMLRFQQTGTPTHYFHAADHRGPFVDTGSELVVPDRLTAERAIKWVRAQRDAPWAAYVNFQMTHFPYKTPSGYQGRYQPSRPRSTFNYFRYDPTDRTRIINRYDNALRYVDEQIGQLYRELERLGQLENTLIVITADHGELFGDHSLVTHGRSLFEGESRVPLVLHWPSKLRPRTYEAPASHLDIMPTILGLLDVSPHPAFQGRDLFSKDGVPAAILMNIQGLRSAEAVVCWPWKYVREARHSALYDLETDPQERANRVESEAEVASALAELLRGHIRAQMRYHARASAPRLERFAPRLPHCPAWFTQPIRELRAEEKTRATAVMRGATGLPGSIPDQSAVAPGAPL